MHILLEFNELLHLCLALDGSDVLPEPNLQMLEIFNYGISTDWPFGLFEYLEYFFIVGFELVANPNTVLSEDFCIIDGIRVHLSSRFM
jgi:hypothetical protein